MWRVVALRDVLRCFGVGVELAAAEFRSEAYCEDGALLGVVARFSVGAALAFSTGLYRDLSACERRMSGPVNTRCANRAHKRYRTLGLSLHNCWAFFSVEYTSRAMFIAFAKIIQSLLVLFDERST